jgi:hypothetical protein
MCRAVVQLHGLDTAQVVVIASKLRVSSRRREDRFGNKFVRLIVKAIVNIIAE